MLGRTDSQSSGIERAVLDAAVAARGHFCYESGHHGDLWLDLDALFVDARRAQGWASALADQAAVCRPELICGPLTGGAFVAQSMAAEIGAGFLFAERLVSATGAVCYRVPASLRRMLRGRRVLLVDDVINAGSALLSTLADLLDCDAELVGLAALLTLGEAASRVASRRIAARYSVPLFTLASLERGMWTPEECPLCSSGVPLVDR